MNKLIIVSGGNSTKDLIPLLVEAKYDVAVFDGQIAELNRQKYGERIIPILAQRGDLQQAALNEAVKVCSQVFTEQDLAMVKNHPLWQPFQNTDIDAFVASWLPGYAFQSLNNQIYLTFLLDELIGKRKVELCVTHEDVTEVFGGLTRWANARKIPTMHVPHGNCYALPEIGPDVHETSICDYIAATPHMEQFYRSRGYAGEIRLTGSPLFDKWVGYRKDKNWACKAFKLDSSKPVVGYFSSWGQLTNAHDSQTRFEESLREVLLCGFGQLVIKLHPGEPQGIEQNYLKMAEGVGAKAVVSRLYLEPILSACDAAVILGPSNCVVDAAIMDVPSVVVRMPGYSIQHDTIPEVEPKEIGQVVNDMLANKAKPEWQSDWLTGRDDFLNKNRFSDHATKNVFEWIKEIAA